MSEQIKHRLLTVFLYVTISLVVAYFFGVIIDANKKITYIDSHNLNLSDISKATILENKHNLLVEDKSGKLFIAVDFNKTILDKNKISYAYENQNVELAIKYILAAVLLGCTILLSIT